MPAASISSSSGRGVDRPRPEPHCARHRGRGAARSRRAARSRLGLRAARPRWRGAVQRSRSQAGDGCGGRDFPVRLSRCASRRGRPLHAPRPRGLSGAPAGGWPSCVCSRVGLCVAGGCMMAIGLGGAVDTAQPAPHKPHRIARRCRCAIRCGGVSRAAKGADCKSAGLRLRRFESYLPHQTGIRYQGQQESITG